MDFLLLMMFLPPTLHFSNYFCVDEFMFLFTTHVL